MWARTVFGESIQGHPFEWSGILLLGMSDMLGNFSEV